MNAGQAKGTFNLVMGWAAFVLAILATAKLFKIAIPLAIAGSPTEIGIVALALAMCRVP
jgi:hypothetical protein